MGRRLFSKRKVIEGVSFTSVFDHAF